MQALYSSSQVWWIRQKMGKWVFVVLVLVCGVGGICSWLVYFFSFSVILLKNTKSFFQTVWSLKGGLFCFPLQIHEEIQNILSEKNRNIVFNCTYHLVVQIIFCLLCIFNSWNLSCLLAGSPSSCFSFLPWVFLSLFTLCICHKHIQIEIQNKFRWCRKRS